MKILLRLIIMVVLLSSIELTALASKLELPSFLKRIESSAFMGDSSLKEVNTQNGLEVIAEKAFAWSGLYKINLADSIIEIDDSAFTGCNIFAVVNKDSYAYDYCKEHSIITIDPSIFIDGQEVKIIDNKGRYIGGIKENNCNGYGLFQWERGDIYEGYWKDDEANGNGVLKTTEGIVLEGSFLNGAFWEGTVKIIQPDNSVLSQTISSGKVAGESTLIEENGNTTTGIISNEGCFEGVTIIQYANGDWYRGYLTAGKKSGEGTYYWTDGAHYMGNWENDMMNGEGVYYYDSDEKKNYLEGEFINNNPQGEVVFISQTEKRYKTTWLDGKCITITAD